jgi:hypothetical protein
VQKSPETGLKSDTALRARDEEGPGGSGLPTREGLRQVVSEWEKSSLCSGSREKQITPCRLEEKGSHLTEKTGMREEEVGL